MIRARVDQRADLGYIVQICVHEDNKFYNFRKKEMVEHKPGLMIDDGCILLMPENIYRAIAETIQRDKSIPKPDQSFVEGKLEATEAHLKDMRSLALKARIA